MYLRRRFSFGSKKLALSGIGLILIVFAVAVFGFIGDGKTVVSPIPTSNDVKIIFVSPSAAPEATVAGQMEEVNLNNE